MELRFPGGEDQKISSEDWNIIGTVTLLARSLAQLLGKLNATTPALQVAFLFCQALKTCRCYLDKTIIQ